MTNKTWNVEVAGQQHIIEVQSGSFAGGCSVTVDGKVAELRMAEECQNNVGKS